MRLLGLLLRSLVPFSLRPISRTDASFHYGRHAHTEIGPRPRDALQLTTSQLGGIKLQLETVEQGPIFFGELHGVAFSWVDHRTV